MASARSAELTAKAASTAAILFTISLDFKASFVKPFIAAVNAITEDAASSPDIRVKIKASFVLFKVSSIPKPCLANSFAASATTEKA